MYKTKEHITKLNSKWICILTLAKLNQKQHWSGLDHADRLMEPQPRRIFHQPHPALHPLLSSFLTPSPLLSLLRLLYRYCCCTTTAPPLPAPLPTAGTAINVAFGTPLNYVVALTLYQVVHRKDNVKNLTFLPRLPSLPAHSRITLMC